MKCAAALVLSSCLALVACKAEPKASPAGPGSASGAVPSEQPRSQLSVRWEGKRFHIDGVDSIPGPYGNFVVPTTPSNREDLALRVYLLNFPKGTKASAGKRSVTVEERQTLIEGIDFANKIHAGLPLQDVAAGVVELGVMLKLELPGKEPLSIAAPPQPVGHAIAKHLWAVEKGPVVFPGEPEKAGPLDSIAVVQARSHMQRLRVLGSGKSLGDLDWVAVERPPAEPRAKSCPTSSGVARVVRGFDTLLKLYERRSGKLIAEHTVPVDLSCELRNTERLQSQTVDSWLTQQLVRR